LVDIPFPSAYRSFISVFNFITLNFVPWQSVGCVTALNYYDKVLVVTITPIVRHMLTVFPVFVPALVLVCRL